MVMFSGPRKSQRAAAGASHPIGLAAPTELDRRRETWRRAAQAVTRTWSECLAADRRDRAACHDRYVSALAEEERAAAELATTHRELAHGPGA